MLTHHIDERIVHCAIYVCTHISFHYSQYKLINTKQRKRFQHLSFIYTAFLYMWFHMSKWFPCSGPTSAFYIMATWRGGRWLSANVLIRVGCEQHALSDFVIVLPLLQRMNNSDSIKFKVMNKQVYFGLTFYQNCRHIAICNPGTN